MKATKTASGIWGCWSALVEGIRAESESEEVVHRLAASAALLVRFAPGVEEVRVA